MSKASEWAIKEPLRPRWAREIDARNHISARVTDRGHLELVGSMGELIVISSEHAESLARWILDTFGEGETP